MKFVLPLLINLNFILTMSGQVTWFPHGAKWHYEYFSFWQGTGVTKLEVLDGDTLIGNNIYKRILSTTTYVPHESNDSLHTYYEMLYAFENDQRVYGYNKWSGSELLYDFNAEVGDTLVNYVGGFSTGYFIVDSIGLMDFNGYQLKFQIIRFDFPFDPDFSFKMKYIEGIGSTFSHFFDPYTDIFVADIPVFHFRCYEDENLGLVKFENIDCDYIPGITSSETASENAVSIFPNPANDFLFVQGNNKPYTEILIVDLLGSIRIKEKTSNFDFNKIDIHGLENGVYFLVGLDKPGQILFTNKFSKFKSE